VRPYVQLLPASKSVHNIFFDHSALLPLHIHHSFVAKVILSSICTGQRPEAEGPGS
jgi:hypothetical protein